MRRGFLAVALLLGAASPTGSAYAEATGDLQVRAPRGASVALDGEDPQPVLNGHGVTFSDVAPGHHVVVALRPGHLPQRAVVEVRPRAVSIHRFDTWPPPPPRTAGPTGDLVVQTVPTNVTVSVPSFGWAKLTKGDAPLLVPGVPAGRHRLTLCTEYKCIDYKADVPEDGLLSLRVRFEPGEVEDDTRHFEARLAEHRRRCAANRDARECKMACVTELQLGRRAGGCLRGDPALVADAPAAEPDPTPAGAARTVPVVDDDQR